MPAAATSTAATTRCSRTTRAAMDLLFDACWRLVEAAGRQEFVTGNNDADGVYLLHWVRAQLPATRRRTCARKLAQWGGNASGVNVANIDNLGNVHPDTMWWHYTLGNVKTRPFSAIWTRRVRSDHGRAEAKPARGQGPLRALRAISTSAAATRACARMQVTGDPWAEDPGCYLADAEIGIAPGSERGAALCTHPSRGCDAMKRIRAPVAARLRIVLVVDALRMARRSAPACTRFGQAPLAGAQQTLRTTTRALRRLPRRRPSRRHGPGAAAGESRAA